MIADERVTVKRVVHTLGASECYYYHLNTEYKTILCNIIESCIRGLLTVAACRQIGIVRKNTAKIT